jgi:hypothetical protein
MKDWISLGFEIAIAAALGWLCWRLNKLRRFYHDAMADLMAEDEHTTEP